MVQHRSADPLMWHCITGCDFLTDKAAGQLALPGTPAASVSPVFTVAE